MDHVATRDPARADEIIDRIKAGCRVLRDHPRVGRARPDIGEGARMLVIERRLALYRIVGADMQVARGVDGTRDLGRLAWVAR